VRNLMRRWDSVVCRVSVLGAGPSTFISKLSTPAQRSAQPSVSNEGSFAGENDRGCDGYSHLSNVKFKNDRH
jgi:hypothetical protein